MKRAIIIGASSGIGHRLAIDLAEAGWQVGVAARRAEPLRTLVDSHTGVTSMAVIDVTAPDAATRLLDLIASHGGMDLLVMSAGTGWVNPALNQSRDQATIAVNCAGFARVIDAAYAYFRDTAPSTPGQIAVITSMAGTKGLGVAASYSASKRFQWAYIDALDQLARQERVNVVFTDIRPGFVDTPLLSTTNGFPMTMAVTETSRLIVAAITRRRRRRVIDSRWRVVNALWRLIPQWLWCRLTIVPPGALRADRSK